MKNLKIAEVLREYRKRNHLSVNEVSNILRENNNYAAPKTIYGWESGNTQPNADTLMFLCKLYKVNDILGSFGYQEQGDYNEIILSSRELQLVHQYRTHPEVQLAIDRLLEMPAEKNI